MINIIIEDGKQNNVKKKNKKRKHCIELLMISTVLYVLTKLSIDHEREITELKKVIEEMKSKGE